MSATPAIAVLDAAGVDYRLHAYDHDPASTASYACFNNGAVTGSSSRVPSSSG